MGAVASPGSSARFDLAEAQEDHPDATGAVLEGHGLIVWGMTSEETQRRRHAAIQRAESFIAEWGRPHPFVPSVPGRDAIPKPDRHRRAAALAPVLRGLASSDRPMIGHFTDSEGVLAFIASSEAPRLADLGTPYPELLSSTKPFPLFLEIEVDDPVEHVAARARLSTRVFEGDTGIITSVTQRPIRRPSGAATRRSSSFPGLACSASARTSEAPGSPARSMALPSK